MESVNTESTNSEETRRKHPQRHHQKRREREMNSFGPTLLLFMRTHQATRSRTKLKKEEQNGWCTSANNSPPFHTHTYANTIRERCTDCFNINFPSSGSKKKTLSPSTSQLLHYYRMGVFFFPLFSSPPLTLPDAARVVLAARENRVALVVEGAGENLIGVAHQ